MGEGAIWLSHRKFFDMFVFGKHYKGGTINIETKSKK